MLTINIWPVIIASVVSFIIGAIWYSPILFGKEWMELTKTDDSAIEDSKKSGMWKRYVIHFIFILISFCVLGFIASATGLDTSTDGAFIAFVIWLGFILPSIISELLWKRTPLKLALIEGVQLLISMVIGGGIIGGWMR